ncbi:MAG: hypothetical protein HYV65_03085 [Candidatus Spechtbacteria bacterium]|nr:hypothetical protein [Candidatus Spechtbacteria bacterium]
MSKSSLAIAVVIVTIAVGIGYWSIFGSRIDPTSLYKAPTSAPSITPPTIPPPPAIQIPNPSIISPVSESEEEINAIVYTDSGFSPESFTVNVGTTVAFTNNSSVSFRPSSNSHPTHTGYPGTDAGKCGTPDAINIFDACELIAPGSYWLFTFNEAGTWGYHDHRKPGNLGTVIVTE